MNSVKVGKVIKEILSNDTALTAIVGDRIYPLIASADNYPLVVYRRSGTYPEDTKDRQVVSAESSIEILAVSDSYEQSVEIASLIGDAMNGKRGMIAGIYIQRIRYDSDDEEYNDGAFVQKTTFKIQIR